MADVPSAVHYPNGIYQEGFGVAVSRCDVERCPIFDLFVIDLGSVLDERLNRRSYRTEGSQETWSYLGNLCMAITRCDVEWRPFIAVFRVDKSPLIEESLVSSIYDKPTQKYQVLTLTASTLPLNTSR